MGQTCPQQEFLFSFPFSPSPVTVLYFDQVDQGVTTLFFFFGYVSVPKSQRRNENFFILLCFQDPLLSRLWSSLTRFRPRSWIMDMELVL